MTPVDHVRYSLLVRHPALSPVEFSHHYERHHGPLALAQPGFRKYTIEYVQHHRIARIAGSLLDLDGITATTQLPRRDYSIGFFQEPDYAAVQNDECSLFDLRRVRSVLSQRDPIVGHGGTHKIFALVRHDSARRLLQRFEAARSRISRLDLSTTSTLGFGAARLDYRLAVEIWTDAEPEPLEENGDEDVQAWSVREIVMLQLDRTTR